jgi:hypothetical protein
MKTLVRIIKLITLSAIAMAVMAGNCAAAETAQMKKKAAMLPILSSNDPLTAKYVTSSLEKCLQERKGFAFVPKEEIEQAVAAGGYDLTKIFGLSKDEYSALGKTLKADYVMHGIVAIRKSLKFTGWRKDVDVYIKLYDGKTGESLDSWRSITDFSFTDVTTETDAQKMAASVTDHICGKMSQSEF